MPLQQQAVWITPSLPRIGPVQAAKGVMHQNGAAVPEFKMDCHTLDFYHNALLM